MGASEILRVLMTGDMLTTREIAERVTCGEGSVKQSMKRLVKDISENVECRLLTPEEKEKKYGRKLGCKINLYWINL